MVACGCTACAHRPPDELMADGGRVASLADWAAHAGLEAGSLNQLAVRQPGADCTVRKIELLHHICCMPFRACPQMPGDHAPRSPQ